MQFEIIGDIEDVQTIAVGRSIREIMRLRWQFGEGRWRKLKGRASILLANRHVRFDELHWYEARGIGRKRMKIRWFLDAKP